MACKAPQSISLRRTYVDFVCGHQPLRVGSTVVCQRFKPDEVSVRRDNKQFAEVETVSMRCRCLSMKAVRAHVLVGRLAGEVVCVVLCYNIIPARDAAV